uniref:MYND-type domain-containing protein n=1 Tax=Caenorhabditis japonica TaxID=281687 RepID=A0A8R1I337_CAEJA
MYCFTTGGAMNNGSIPKIVKMSNGGGGHQIDMTIEEKTRKLMVDLQKHWTIDYKNSQEKALVELTEKLHQEFLADQLKIRSELLQQFKEQLEQTRTEMELKYREDLKAESAKLNEKHRRELAAAKKKQWCWQCENEAIYHCCWNTAYCSVDCQQGHWATHRKFCRRKKGGSGAPGNAAPAMQS